MPPRSTWKGYEEQPRKPRDAFLPKDAEMALSRYVNGQNVSPRESCIDLIERDMQGVVKLTAYRAPLFKTYEYTRQSKLHSRFRVGTYGDRRRAAAADETGARTIGTCQKTISGGGSHSSSWSITTSTRGS